MKNWKKISLITGGVLTVFGSLLLIFGLLAGGIKYLSSTNLSQFSDSDPEAKSGRKLVTKALDPYKSLDVSLDSMNLQVRFSKDNTYALSYESTNTSKGKDRAPITWKYTNDTLKIRERTAKEHTSMHIDLNFLIALFGNDDEKEAVTNEDVVTLYIPENTVFKQVALENHDGNLLLNHLQTKQGIITTDDGDITLKNCAFRNTIFTSDDGDVLSSSTTYSGTAAINCKDGNIFFYRAADTLKSLTLQLETKDGDITIPSTFSGKVQESDDHSTYHTKGLNDAGQLSVQSEDGDIILR